MAEWTPIRSALAAAGAILLAWMASSAPAQPLPEGGSLPTGEIDVSADVVGVGGVARRGEYVGVRLVLTDSSDRPRDVLVRIAIRDADGDRALFERVVATNPGVRQPVWLYFQLPLSFQGTDLLNVLAFTALERTGPDPARPRYDAGRLLGQARIGTRGGEVLSAQEGAYGIIGRKQLGLRPYDGRFAGQSAQRSDHPAGHERTELALFDPTGVPDRWMGLAQFDAIVWGEGQPAQLTPELAHAVREWVRRGGHLIIVIPRVGQSWMDGAGNPLFDIIPHVRVERRENTALIADDPGNDDSPRRFDEVLWRNPPGRPVPPDAIHVFRPQTGEDWGDAIPILNARGTDPATPGDCFAVRRLEGAGAVTLIGLDLTARAFDSQGLPDAGTFWHRILGRREPLPSERELGRTDRSNQASGLLLTESRRDSYTVDRDFAGQVDRTGSAAAGVLLGFVVFVLYWLVAGPVGFFVLRRFGYERHAWAAFLGAAGLFTGIAWGGATAIRPARTEGTHLTLLDHVYGQPWQRTRTWLNLLVPAYGDATLRVGDPLETGSVLDATQRFHNVVSPWNPEAGVGGGFPDARGYSIESKAPEAVTFPTRSTVKLFQLEWAGGPRWQMPTPEPGADGAPGVIRLLPPGRDQPWVSGVLRHRLPGPLREVTVVVVRGQRPLQPSLVSPNTRPTLLADVVAATQPGDWEWAPDEPWDLSAVKQKGTTEENRREADDWLRALTTSLGDNDNVATPDAGRQVNRLKALSFFTQLEPPELFGGPSRDERLIARRFTHGWDLGRWFTQPCVIIVGVLGDGGESPTPIQVDTGGGFRRLPTRGRTLVRWVYPLPADPPAWPENNPEPVAAPPGDGGGG